MSTSGLVTCRYDRLSPEDTFRGWKCTRLRSRRGGFGWGKELFKLICMTLPVVIMTTLTSIPWAKTRTRDGLVSVTISLVRLCDLCGEATHFHLTSNNSQCEPKQWTSSSVQLPIDSYGGWWVVTSTCVKSCSYVDLLRVLRFGIVVELRHERKLFELFHSNVNEMLRY